MFFEGSIARAALADFLLLLLLFRLLLSRLRLEPRLGEGGSSGTGGAGGGPGAAESEGFVLDDVRDGILTSDGCLEGFSVIVSLFWGAEADKSEEVSIAGARSRDMAPKLLDVRNIVARARAIEMRQIHDRSCQGGPEGQRVRGSAIPDEG